jgi:type II secretory pathway pseudopilin PulG
MYFTTFRSRNSGLTRRAFDFSNYTITQFPNYKIASPRRRHSERGYILLILLLFTAVLSISLLAAVRRLDFQVKRDREEEMIHRGVQYSRAVRRFYKKFGRYPTRIEDLESTNNLRFLRKRYKDPLNRDPKTGKELDFKLLHLQDVQMSFNSAPTPGVVAVSDLANGAPAQSSTDVQAGAPGALNNNTAGPTGQGTGPIAGQQNPQNSQPNDQSNAQPDQANAGQGTPPPAQPLPQQLGANGAPQVFGGGAIVGVASANKDKTIRVFNKKDHYNQWQFIYDPTTDRGGLLMTPNQPPLQNAAQNVNQQQPNGQPGSFGINGQNTGGPNFGNGMNSANGINSGNGNNSPNNQPPQPNLPPDQNQ